MTAFLQDLRYALRQLRKSPGFTVTAVLSLVCGIAATTAVFSVVFAVLVNPYPYANSDRIVHLTLGGLGAGGDYNGFSVTPAQWQQLRESSLVEDAVLTSSQNLTLSGGDLPENVRANYFSSNGWNFFGVPAALGRGILPSDAVGGADPAPVAVLGYKFWQHHYLGDPAIVGKTVRLDRQPYTIVGVAARRFTWGDSDVYLPLKLDNNPRHTGQAELRLKPGVTHAMIEQQLQPLITRFAKENPNNFPAKLEPLHVIGLNEQFVRALGPTLAMLFAAVMLLLAIGCANVSILLLARGTMRRHEFAVRAAIGATRNRIVRQLLTESLLLSLTGAALGVLCSYKLVDIVVALLPENAFPHEAAIQINLPVLGFCVIVAVLTGVLFGLSPALRLSRPDVREAMQSNTRRLSGNAGKAAHHALVAGQIALTLLLLTLAGAAAKSFLRLAHTHLGYDPHNVMAIGLPLRDGAYTTVETRSNYIESLRQKLVGTPGVESVAISTNATPPDNGFAVPAQVLGLPPDNQDNIVRWNLISQDYFSLLHVPLRSGRLWTEAEERNAAPVAIVNQAFVRKYLNGTDPLGRSVRTNALKPDPPYVVVRTDAGAWRQIVGTIEDKLDQGLGKPVLPEVFTPYSIGMGPWSQLLVRTSGAPLTQLPALSRKIAAVDPDQQVSSQIRDLEGWLHTTNEYAQGQFIAWLFGAFATVALLLAAVGLYSVLSYTVAQRTTEFGVRMALGAMRKDVLALVARSAGSSLALGAAIGTALSLLLLRLLHHLIAGPQKMDFAALLLALLVLTAAAIVAAGIPSRRALRIEPMEAIRYE